MSLNERKPDSIIILDFGGQYCHLIARRIREMNVYSEILPSDSTPVKIRELEEVMKVKGIILSGSPASVNSSSSPEFNPEILDLGIPIMGLCYGHQLIASLNGCELRKGEIMEYGITEVFIERAEGVLQGLNEREIVWMSHGDTVNKMSNEFIILARTEASPVAAFKHNYKPLWGLQWHPEVIHTKQGKKMLKNFVFEICKCKQNWRPLDTIEQSIDEIKTIVGDKKAVIALSGGVDSSVAAALAQRALGDRLVAIHVDTGLMRINESQQVIETFRNQEVELILVNSKVRFLEKLAGITDPEKKRRVIGEEFIRIFEEKARQLGAEYLIQGTIYPDTIESGIGKNSDTIKTHHNVGGLPSQMEFKKIIEPLKDLYKDEVRGLGERLGLPKEVVWRQPFPGPGLAVRIIGAITKEKLEIIRKADAIVCEEIEIHPFKYELWQYFAVLTNTKSTGIKGDERAYGWTIAIRIVESIDAMTANFGKISWEVLEHISNRLGNEIPSVIRVVYDITHKPPSTIEWE
jgi:GMP synthase (glutamine-hydrolysing)